MGEEETKGVEKTEVAPPPPPPEAVKDVAEEKAPLLPPAEDKPDDIKALAIVEMEDPPKEKSSGGSTERDAALARLESEKRLSLIKAWEENEKAKADNKSAKKLSAVTAWENSKKAAIEAELKRKEDNKNVFTGIQQNKKKEFIKLFQQLLCSTMNELIKDTIYAAKEELEKKKAEYAETMKNKIALLHKAAEEKRAMVEARRGEELLKADEMAAKYRATGLAPKKLLGCFGA